MRRMVTMSKSKMALVYLEDRNINWGQSRCLIDKTRSGESASRFREKNEIDCYAIK
jgi:hypothetical protein